MSMKRALLFIKKNKYLFAVDIMLILMIVLFPMKELTDKNTIGVRRTGIILEPGVVVSQEFTSEFNDIERISLMMATFNKSISCTINVGFFDENGNKLSEKTFNNMALKKVQKDQKDLADYVNLYLKNKITGAFNKKFYVRISTDCDNIVCLQYYEAELNDKKAMYGNVETKMKLPIRYSNSKYSNNNFLYSIVIIIISLIIILGGKNEKK